MREIEFTIITNFDIRYDRHSDLSTFFNREYDTLRYNHCYQQMNLCFTTLYLF